MDGNRILGVHWIVCLLVVLALCIGVSTVVSRAHAQHVHGGHEQFHAYYQSWTNGEPKNCCNDRDCKALNDAHERHNGGKIEVFVNGVGSARGQSAWCEVHPHHYLSRGNAPNWGTAHICVTDHYKGKTPCEQFICYQPKPQI